MKLKTWLAMATIALGAATVTPLTASADVSEPDDPICSGDALPAECGPGDGGIDYSPPQYDAIGRDTNLTRARDEAEDLAAAHCPGGDFDVVRVRAPLQDNGVWRYTLTYTC